MKPKKMNVRGKPNPCLNVKLKTGKTDETAIMEKLQLQNTALEKIKTAVLISKGISQDEAE